MNAFQNALRQMFRPFPRLSGPRRVRLRLEELESRLTPTGVFPQFNLVDPAGSVDFGAEVVPLSTGNVVVTDPLGNGGAAYLFNGQTGALISALTGLGDAPTATALTNGNYVVDSPNWNGGVGAVTWGSGTTGVGGTVSAANSLVGTTVFDHVGGAGGSAGGGITALANGNYVVDSPTWGSTGSTGIGAVTWGNGAKGTSGVVSAANSIVGSSAFDQVGGGSGLGGVTALTNGNYVVDSPAWGSDGTQPDGLGAATWGNGATGTSGVISAANSLVGGAMGDVVGWADGRSSTQDGVIALTNGNYVVDSMPLERAERRGDVGQRDDRKHRRRLGRQQSRRQQRGRWWVYGSSGRQRRRRAQQRQLCCGKPDLERRRNDRGRDWRGDVGQRDDGRHRPRVHGQQPRRRQ